MHMRRFACFLLGLWLGGYLFLAVMTVQNMRLAERLLASPAAGASRLMRSGPEAGRLLRHQVRELNLLLALLLLLAALAERLFLRRRSPRTAACSTFFRRKSAPRSARASAGV